METSESQTDFITRALLARDEAKATGEYYTEEEVLRELDDLLTGVPQAIPLAEITLANHPTTRPTPALGL